MSQKDQIIRAYAHDYRDMNMDEIELAVMLVRCNNEIIEKLIADIPDGIDFDTPNMGKRNLKQQLSNHWL